MLKILGVTVKNAVSRATRILDLCFIQILHLKTFYNQYLYFKTLLLHVSVSKTYPYLNIFMYMLRKKVSIYLKFRRWVSTKKL